MPSTFSWLDYSAHEARKAAEIIKLFEERGTVDELGLGSIRDPLANLLFPGTSIIQSRARYFLFIPWIYVDLERNRVPAADIARRARNDETRLIEALKSSEDPRGTIGRLAGAALRTLPSAIYWQGLRKWGILLYPGPRDYYHRSLDGYYRSSVRSRRADDGDPELEAIRPNWDPYLPPRPKDFPQIASFRLTRAEAEYFRDHILRVAPRSLLAFLVNQCGPAEATRFPWEYPDASRFPEHNRVELEHARCFSEVVYGAALLYNLLVARAVPLPDRIELYSAELAEWATTLRTRSDALGRWNREAFWSLIARAGGHITPHTRLFVNRWLDLALECWGEGIPEDLNAQRLVRDREVALKGGLAHLSNRRRLDMWQGAAGAFRLDYRWSVVQGIASDVQRGLREAADAGA